MRLYFAILIFGLLSVARAVPPDVAPPGEDATPPYYCTAKYGINFETCYANEVTRPCPLRTCTTIIKKGNLLATGEIVKLEKSIIRKTQQCRHNRSCGRKDCKCRDYFATETVQESYHSKDVKLRKSAKIVIRYPAKCKCARKRNNFDKF
uniref:uncharacterized protein LOC120333629 n=1 Tax=Styela clava TaxID=7725 RepID=UPI0019393F94|nr:uncharacterized protein LOC120333629 [Styela clava]